MIEGKFFLGHLTCLLRTVGMYLKSDMASNKWEKGFQPPEIMLYSFEKHWDLGSLSKNNKTGMSQGAELKQFH